jgi:hypothetical protein
MRTAHGASVVAGAWVIAASCAAMSASGSWAMAQADSIPHAISGPAARTLRRILE